MPDTPPDLLKITNMAVENLLSHWSAVTYKKQYDIFVSCRKKSECKKLH